LFVVCLGRLTRKPRCNTLFLCSILREKRAKHRCEPCASVMLHLRAHLGAWTVPIPSVLSVQVLCGSKKGHRPLFRPKYTKRRFFGDLLGGGAPAHPSQGHRGAARSSAYTYIRIPIINLENQGVHFGSRVHMYPITLFIVALARARGRSVISHFESRSVFLVRVHKSRVD